LKELTGVQAKPPSQPLREKNKGEKGLEKGVVLGKKNERGKCERKKLFSLLRVRNLFGTHNFNPSLFFFPIPKGLFLNLSLIPSNNQ